MTTAPDPRSMRERMDAGDLYIPDDPELWQAMDAAQRLASEYNSTTVDSRERRHQILNELLGSWSHDSEIRPPFYVDYGRNLTIGKRFFANYGFVALDVAAITIGDDVQCGPNVQLLTPTHPIDPELRRAKWESAAPIVIADNVWLGGGAIVLGGVSIGANSVVGAGAVVTRDVPANTVVVGSPARVVRTIE